MNEMAKSLRAKMRGKAKAMSSQKDSKTDSSDWSPAEPLNADVKTGMRPVSRRTYKTGGKVEGEACAPRADRKPRKSGGEAKAWMNAKINRNVKDANEEREGIKHVGGLKTGGRAHKLSGGALERYLDKAYDDRTDTENAMRGRFNRTNRRDRDAIKMGDDRIARRDRGISMAERKLADKDQLKTNGLKKGGKVAKKAEGGPADMAPGASSGTATKKPENVYRPGYDKEAVDKAISSSRQKIGGKEASAIHSLLKGRTGKNQGGAKGGFSTQKDASEEMSAADQARAAAAAKAARDRAQQEGAGVRKAGGRAKKMGGGTLAGLLGGLGPAAAAGAFDGKDEKKSGGRAKRKDGGKVNYGPMEMPDGKKGASEKEQRATEDHQRSLSKASRGKAQQYADGGYLKFKGEPVIPGMKKGGRMERKAGGRAKKPGTNVNIVIQTKPSPAMGAAPGMDAGPIKPPGAVPVPVPPPGMGAPPMGGMPMPPPAPPLGGGLPGGMPPMARKSGGRITKIAKSYKDMEAGAAGGEGRLQKTDIAKSGKGAPTYKKGGKVYSSYKDMDAGAGSGEGRLEKSEIQKRMH